MSNMEIIKEVRNRSHASLKDCASAVDEASGDVEKALKILQEKGIIKAADRTRVASEGRIQTYLHGEGRISVAVEVNCETDFAARSPAFKEFCELVAMQIAAMSPRWVRREEVPQAAVDEQLGILGAQVAKNSRPEEVRQKVIAGKLDKWYSEVCLLEQKPVVTFDHDTVEKMRAVLSSKLGETVTVRRFVRWEVGEGIAKALAGNYAAEVAALAGARE